MANTPSLTEGEEQIAFYYWLGEAIAAWAFVENHLRHIAAQCIDGGPDNIQRKALAVGFFSIDGFRAKLDFVEALVARRFPAREAEWAPYVKKARELSRLRNKLAHRSVALYQQSDPGRRFLLVPWIFPKPKHKKPPKRPIPPEGALGVRDLMKFSDEFTCFAVSLENFAARLAGQPEPNVKALERPRHPPTIAMAKAQIREALARLLAPSEK